MCGVNPSGWLMCAGDALVLSRSVSLLKKKKLAGDATR